MEEKIHAIEKNRTWKLVEQIQDKKIVGVKWVHKVKLNPDGSIQKKNARFVAKGYSLQFGIDYNDTFALIAKFDTTRTFIDMVAQKGWNLYQIDIKSAFLNGELKEKVPCSTTSRLYQRRRRKQSV